MSLDETFRNLNQNELALAIRWYENLRAPEQTRVAETLRVLDQTRFDFPNDTESNVRAMATIVAGSSIDTPTYPDIDLFLLSEKSLFSKNQKRKHPAATVGRLIERQLPKYSYFVRYKETDLSEEPAPRELIATGLGARVTVSLFYELVGFQIRRNRRGVELNDVLEPAGLLDAEKIIDYNRQRQSKFLVLSRQYTPS